MKKIDILKNAGILKTLVPIDFIAFIKKKQKKKQTNKKQTFKTKIIIK